MSVLCQHRGCTRSPQVALTVNVPAKGWPIALHQPIRMVVSLQLCRPHAAQAKPAQILNGDLMRAIEATCRLDRKAAPDFERAFISPISLTGDEYLNFVALQHGRTS